MSRVTVVARLTVKEDAIESVKTELLKLVMPTREEQGCIEYNLHQDNEDPDVFVFYETWENLACLEAHMNSAHFNFYINAVDGLIKEKVVHKMTRIA